MKLSVVVLAIVILAASSKIQKQKNMWCGPNDAVVQIERTFTDPCGTPIISA